MWTDLEEPEEDNVFPNLLFIEMQLPDTALVKERKCLVCCKIIPANCPKIKKYCSERCLKKATYLRNKNNPVYMARCKAASKLYQEEINLIKKERKKMIDSLSAEELIALVQDELDGNIRADKMC